MISVKIIRGWSSTGHTYIIIKINYNLTKRSVWKLKLIEKKFGILLLNRAFHLK
jgi:hypothetical protein